MRLEYKKLIKNTGLFAIGTFATSLLGLLMTPLYTSVLSTQDYGISDLITVTTALLMPLLSCAVYEGIMRFSLDKDANHGTILSFGLGISCIGVLIVALFLPLTAKTTIGPYKWYFIAYFAANSFHTIIAYFVKGIEKVKSYTVSGVVGSVVFIGCNLFFLLYLKIGIDGYLLSLILSSLISSVYLFFKEKLYGFLVPPTAMDKGLIRSILLYSIPIIPNGISWWIANSSDKYILNYYADVSQVGIYSVSYKIPTIMMTVMGFFIAAWQLSSVEEFGSDKSKKFFSDVYNKYVLLSVIVATLLIITAKPFAYFLYKKEFFEAWNYVPVLVIANIFNILSSFMGTIYTGAKKTKMLSLSTMIGAGANILLNFLLIPVMGAMGAALATAVSYAVIQLIRVFHSRHIMVFEVNHKRNTILYVLLIIQAWLVLTDTIIGIVLSAAICLIILICCRGVMEAIVQIIISKFKIQNT